VRDLTLGVARSNNDTMLSLKVESDEEYDRVIDAKSRELLC
jgi:hypothetical protein